MLGRVSAARMELVRFPSVRIWQRECYISFADLSAHSSSQARSSEASPARLALSLHSELPYHARMNGPRRGLALFGGLTLVGTAILQTWLIRSGKPIAEQGPLILLLMWIPGLSSVLTRVVLREGFGDISLKIGGRPGWQLVGLAWVYPIPIGIAAYGVAWMSGLTSFSSPPLAKLGLDWGSDAAHLGARTLLAIGLTPLSCIWAFGEELGWRGYLVPRLVEAGVARPLLVSGLIWGLWHVPLILTGQYIHSPIPWLGALMFIGAVTADAFLLGWMRLRTGSVWPAVIGHASWNSIIQGAFDQSTPTPSIWVGEGGILTMLSTVLFVGLVLHMARKRSNLEPMERFT